MLAARHVLGALLGTETNEEIKCNVQNVRSGYNTGRYQTKVWIVGQRGWMDRQGGASVATCLSCVTHLCARCACVPAVAALTAGTEASEGAAFTVTVNNTDFIK
jgi:hypothetical protein